MYKDETEDIRLSIDDDDDDLDYEFDENRVQYKKGTAPKPFVNSRSSSAKKKMKKKMKKKKEVVVIARIGCVKSPFDIVLVMELQ